MVKTCGKALLGLCAAAAVLALLIHWITPATILHYREDLLFYLQAHLVLVFSSMAAACWSACRPASCSAVPACRPRPNA